MKNARQPKNTRIPVLSHHGHGPFLLLVYLNSRLSKTGMAYIWNEVRQLITTNRLANPKTILGVSFLWYSSNALNIPPFIIFKNYRIPVSPVTPYSNWKQAACDDYV